MTGLTCQDDGTCGVGIGDLKQLVYSQQSAHFRGAEGEATVPLYNATGGGILEGGMLSAKLIADYVRATLPGVGNVPRIPPYHVGGGLDWQGEVFDLGFLLKYAGRQTHIGPTDTPTAGFVNLNANLAVRPFPTNRNIEFSIIGHNLTNSVQRDAVSLNKDDVVLPGRDVRFSVRMDF